MSNEIKSSQNYSHRYFMTFLVALLGALCGSVIYIALNILNVVDTALVYIISGLAAYAFCAVFLSEINWCKKNMIFVTLACLVNTIISSIVYFALFYAPQMGGEGFETLYDKLMGAYNFTSAGLKNYAQILMCFALSMIGCGLLLIIYKPKKWKKVELYGHKRKQSNI